MQIIGLRNKNPYFMYSTYTIFVHILYMYIKEYREMCNMNIRVNNVIFCLHEVNGFELIHVWLDRWLHAWSLSNSRGEGGGSEGVSEGRETCSETDRGRDAERERCRGKEPERGRDRR